MEGALSLVEVWSASFPGRIHIHSDEKGLKWGYTASGARATFIDVFENSSHKQPFLARRIL
ncbi:hypothetical protein SYN63AY4M2_05285 [Synechococcus sp. 63AY4M2]|nr:hypothetical protein SYN63AY4M2_05285 [Synechococcus sp. 63AY4M2]PIK96425.1 hypothetical protein SYN60AY4M2_05840 [Synechococcus sp. 60AY4M2]PIK99022.1 hypothetical protein SYN63AY4M1_03295 [Synechococcus sp. 63AY4M1]PIL02531.1 hypothetical protein SYN65AY640_10810 [Synechococcus sp. 65AY640]